MAQAAKTKLKEVSRAYPCEVCGGDHKCSRGEDGLMLCGRRSGPQPGFVYLGQSAADPQWGMYRRDDDPHLSNGQPPPSDNGHEYKAPPDWDAKAKTYAKALTPARRRELAEDLGLPEVVFEMLPALGYMPKGPHAEPGGPCWTFPEHDAAYQVVGVNCRYINGQKKAMSGGGRGLTIPAGWKPREGAIYLPEGASCTLALTVMGLPAVGRPSNRGGVDHLVGLLKAVPAERQIIVLGEYDANDNGDWPGRDGAEETAAKLAEKLNRPVEWALPPDKAKDVRAWVLAQKPDPTLDDAWHDLGQRFAALVSVQRLKAEPAEEPPIPEAPAWPDPPAAEAFHGLAGAIVRTIEPASEADPAALLAQALVEYGNAIGRSAYFRVEADAHRGNESLVVVGRTSKARKGTSFGRVHGLYRDVEEQWATERVQTGLSSGEGLIWAVRDAIKKQERVKERGLPVRYEEVEADPGVQDKRLLVYEPEFVNVLKQTERPGNTLSPVIRQAWDGGAKLRTMTKNSPACATDAHVSTIGHITTEELRRYLTGTESANGFGNRILWVCAERSKLLPEGGRVDTQAWESLRHELAAALAFGRSAGEIKRDEEAAGIWREIYGELSDGKPGLAGALLARGEAHVMRLALVYALMDCSTAIQAPHLMAATALWEYCERSVYYVFGDQLGDPLADDLLRLLRASPHGLTRTEIQSYLGRNQPSSRIGPALGLLLQHRLARSERQETGGRHAERWFATKGR
jgi:hypothetical protein